mgnify:CR=1 FL=1
MTKKIFTMIPVILLFSVLPFYVAAEILPEENPIGETIYIEPDENIIRENIVNGNPDESFKEETGKTISMDRSTYIEECIFPFLWIVGAGIGVFGVSEAGKKLYKRKKL